MQFIETPDAKTSKKISEYLNTMLEYIDSTKSEYQIKFISLLYDFLFMLLQNVQKSGISQNRIFSDHGISRIAPVISYVEKNFRKKISLPEAASIINVTSEHLCRMFKKYMDMTFNEYLMALRISSFYQGLMTSDLKISTLLEENGITNYKVFIRDFKQIFGKTPEEVRAERKPFVKDSKEKPIIKDGLETPESRRG